MAPATLDGLLLETAVYWTARWALISLISNVLLFIAMGTNKGLADPILVVPWMIVASTIAGFQRFSPAKMIAAGLAGLAVLAGFLSFYTATQTTRIGTCQVHDYLNICGMSLFADYDNPLVYYLAPDQQVGVLALTGYITHGYFGLSLALDEPFVPAFGVGNSMFLTRQAARIMGSPEILDLPYPNRLEKRGIWDAYIFWPSFYAWIASDVSFPGTILVVFLIGRFFAQSWIDTISGKNPIAVIMLSYYIIMLYYFPANNTVAQAGESLSGLCVTFIIWRLSRGGAPGRVARC